MSFKIMTTKPSGNKFFITKSAGGYSTCIQGKPTDPKANVLSNCVGFACGRYNMIYAELTGYNGMKYPSLNCNAENFTERAKNTYGLTVVPYPTLGGIMVWEGLGSLAGHVAIVEKIIDGNTIYTSESGYGGTAFWNSTRSNSNGRWGLGTNYRFKGCIVNPAIGDVHYVKPTPAPSTPVSGDVDQLARDVIKGKYGNGQARKDALGSRYAEVQRRVNEILAGNTKPASSSITYTVVRGDTLSGIGARYGVDYHKIARDNNIANPNLIYEGQKIVIKK